MIREGIHTVLHHFTTGLSEIASTSQNRARNTIPKLPLIDPVWPLPRRADGLSDDGIYRAFAQYPLWHYAYAFEGGITFSAHHQNPGLLTNSSKRPIQRFRHFMPYLLSAHNGSLRGKRILDIACNSGFWSIQCALLGAEVVGFDARPELIGQANLVKSIVGLENVEFRELHFADMTPQSLGGTFDIVLNLGILYHLPSPLEALQRTMEMTRSHILLDTTVARTLLPSVRLRWEEPTDIRTASHASMACSPSKHAVGLMLRHLGAADWFEIPIRTRDMPLDYLSHGRASWLITV